MADKNLTLNLATVNNLLDTFNKLKNILTEYKEFIELVNESDITLSDIEKHGYMICPMKGEAYLMGLDHAINYVIPECMKPLIDYASEMNK
jgi:hypothetical protein